MRQINVMQRGEKRRHEKYPSVRFVGVCLDGVARLVKVHASSGLVRAVPQTWRNKLQSPQEFGLSNCVKSHNNWVTRSCNSALNNSLGVHFTADLVIAFTGSSVCIPPKAGRQLSAAESRSSSAEAAEQQKQNTVCQALQSTCLTAVLAHFTLASSKASLGSWQCMSQRRLR